jgi:nucleoside-diphosphate-sugar epimerase
MPSVLIAGCGYLGRAIASRLHNAGWTVEGWTRSIESAKEIPHAEYPIRAVNIATGTELSTYNWEFDVIIHSASTRGGDADLYREVYFDGARNLLNHFGHSIVVFVGSTSVYAQTSGEWVTEESAAEPRHSRGKILRQAEQLVLERGGIIARLAGIYGPGRSYLLQRFLTG